MLLLFEKISWPACIYGLPNKTKKNLKKKNAETKYWLVNILWTHSFGYFHLVSCFHKTNASFEYLMDYQNRKNKPRRAHKKLTYL